MDGIWLLWCFLFKLDESIINSTKMLSVSYDSRRRYDRQKSRYFV